MHNIIEGVLASEWVNYWVTDCKIVCVRSIQLHYIPETAFSREYRGSAMTNHKNATSSQERNCLSFTTEKDTGLVSYVLAHKMSSLGFHVDILSKMFDIFEYRNIL